MLKEKKTKKVKEAPKGVRSFPLVGKAAIQFDKLVEYAEKNELGTRASLFESYFDAWEADNPFGIQIRKFPFDNEQAQRWVVDWVKGQLGRKVTKPVYGAIFRAVSARSETTTDDKTGRKTPVFRSFGQAKLINLKTNAMFEEKLAEITAYGDDVEKVEDIEVGEITYIEAACSNTNPTLLQLVVDDRCKESTKSDQKLKPFDKVIKSFYEVTKIRECVDNPSKDKFDLRLVEGRLVFIQFPKTKNYAILELTDESISLEILEKRKSKANLRILVNKELVTSIGKDSIVQILGQIKKDNHPEYGESVAMLFPNMVNPILTIPPENGSSNDDEEEGTDAKAYFDKKSESPSSKKYDEEDEDDEDEDEDEDEEEDESPEDDDEKKDEPSDPDEEEEDEDEDDEKDEDEEDDDEDDEEDDEED